MSLTIDATAGTPLKVTGTTAAAQEVWANPVYIKFIYWYQPTTVGHLLNITNKEGKEITTAYCEVANESQFLPIFGRHDGIYCDDMDSGTLYIYII